MRPALRPIEELVCGIEEFDQQIVTELTRTSVGALRSLPIGFACELSSRSSPCDRPVEELVPEGTIQHCSHTHYRMKIRGPGRDVTGSAGTREGRPRRELGIGPQPRLPQTRIHNGLGAMAKLNSNFWLERGAGARAQPKACAR